MNAPESTFQYFQRYVGPPEPGFFINFLGVRTRTYFVDWFANHDGHILNYPVREHPFFHDHDEWLGTLRAVIEAKQQIVVGELGAGFGPWLTNVTAAAKQRGIKNVKLIAVEPMASHVEMLHQHFRDNNIDPANHTIMHALVGTRDGKAWFPDAHRDDWGAKADLTRDGETRSISLDTLFKPYDQIDLVHCDIQGSEAEVLRSAYSVLCQKVRRIVIGTHSEKIEAELRILFRRWRNEADVPCRINGDGVLVADGTQVWAQPTGRFSKFLMRWSSR